MALIYSAIAIEGALPAWAGPVCRRVKDARAPGATNRKASRLRYLPSYL
jgi:hypothetical protein